MWNCNILVLSREPFVRPLLRCCAYSEWLPQCWVTFSGESRPLCCVLVWLAETESGEQRGTVPSLVFYIWRRVTLDLSSQSLKCIVSSLNTRRHRILLLCLVNVKDDIHRRVVVLCRPSGHSLVASIDVVRRVLRSCFSSCPVYILCCVQRLECVAYSVAYKVKFHLGVTDRRGRVGGGRTFRVVAVVDEYWMPNRLWSWLEFV